MFTGIIEEKGRIKEKEDTSLLIEAKIACDLNVGDSVAVNGVCLTVVNLLKGSFLVEVMPETLRLTNLGLLNIRDLVNLERAMEFGGRLGGHLLSGHIDGLGRLIEKRREKNAWLVRLKAPSSLTKYMVKRSSIALDGISLTIADISEDVFSVYITPYTYKMTTIGEREPWSKINIEVDLVAKYIEQLLKRRENVGITQEILRGYGFV